MVTVALFFACLFATSVAPAATTRIVVTVEPSAAPPPEIEEEVRGALSSRVPGMKAALVEVHLTAHAAEIYVDGKTASVEVSDWAGGAATRVVVAHAVDLATPLPAPALLVDPRPPVAVARRADPLSIVLSAAPQLSRGLESADGVAAGGELRGTLRRGRFLAGIAATWSHGHRSEDGKPWVASWNLWPVALVAGWSWRRLEAIAGPFAGPQRLAIGETRRTGVAFGGTATLRWVEQGGDGWSWFAGGGVNLYANPLTLEYTPSASYSTPRLAPYLAGGVSFAFAP